MLHWIFFAVAGAFLVGSFLRNRAAGKDADAPRNEGKTPGENED